MYFNSLPYKINPLNLTVFKTEQKLEIYIYKYKTNINYGIHY